MFWIQINSHPSTIEITPKPRVFQNSKNIMRDKHSLENFGILENPRVFLNFEEFQKKPRFFGILVENLEKPKVFLEFIMKF